MVRIQLEPDVLSKLRSAGDRVEIIDEAGAVVGWYEPLRRIPQEVLDSCPYTDEELAEFAKKATTGRPLREILRDLGAE
ncbi:MAG: hypothetical protein ACRCT8_07335 [Lacipirellulaceae bacterium]